MYVSLNLLYRHSSSFRNFAINNSTDIAVSLNTVQSAVFGASSSLPVNRLVVIFGPPKTNRSFPIV